MKITINEGEDGATLEGIPDEVWERFKELAKLQFPKAGEDAWAAYLSEAILSGAGGNGQFTTYFMTDVPVENADALDKVLSQAGWRWDNLHAYILRSAPKPGALRVINFTSDPQQSGIFIATGISLQAFHNLQAQTGMSPETIIGALFNAAHSGIVSFTGQVPTVVQSA